MQSIIILLHRPFIAHWEQQKGSSGLAPFKTPDPAEVCIQAAKSICLILETHSEYISLLPSDLIFIVFTVAGIIRHECQKKTPGHAELSQFHKQLRNCMQWLQVFGKNWKNADARQNLLNMSESPKQSIIATY
jgi:hypothetical protein